MFVLADDIVLHVIKGGHEDTYIAIEEDAFESADYGRVTTGSMKEIEEKFGIELLPVKKPNYFLRLLGLPFVAGINITMMLYAFCYNMAMFVKHGGEYIAYQDGETLMIRDIYKELKSLK